jgi:hypothetical protein
MGKKKGRGTDGGGKKGVFVKGGMRKFSHLQYLGWDV